MCGILQFEVLFIAVHIFGVRFITIEQFIVIFNFSFCYYLIQTVYVHFIFLHTPCYFRF